MKTTELRIGNLVTDSSGFICEIKEIRSGTVKVKYHSDKDRYCIKSLCEIFPVKLTEEWLIKFGFDKDSQNKYRLYSENCGLIGICEHKELYTNKHLSFFFNIGGSYSVSSIDIQIKHVHQLQNLYFALTGEELTCS